MGELKFRTLLCRTANTRSELLADGVDEGPALLAALDVLDSHRRTDSSDETPAKNVHGSRRWEIRDGGDVTAYLYVEPTCDVAAVAPEWLAAGGYPDSRGWWRDSRDGTPGPGPLTVR